MHSSAIDLASQLEGFCSQIPVEVSAQFLALADCELEGRNIEEEYDGIDALMQVTVVGHVCAYKQG